MSFSSKTKNDLARLTTEDRCCHQAELSGLLRASGSIRPRAGGMGALVVTENAAVARLIFSLFKKTFGIHAEVLASVNRVLNKGHSYTVRLPDASRVLEELEITDNIDGGLSIRQTVPQKLLRKNCCKRAYLRGMFLGGGSVSDPEKAYHLELVAHDPIFAESLKKLVNGFHLSSKTVQRKNNWIVYLKEGDQIVDMLNIIGAHGALMAFEDVRIIKQMRNDVNRLVNCETANLNKTVEAAVRQIQCIEYIRDTAGLSYLPENLLEIAELRLENPDVSLTELGDMLNPPVGKSGVNHRMRKIEQIGEKLKLGREDSR